MSSGKEKGEKWKMRKSTRGQKRAIRYLKTLKSRGQQSRQCWRPQSTPQWDWWAQSQDLSLNVYNKIPVPRPSLVASGCPEKQPGPARVICPDVVITGYNENTPDVFRSPDWCGMKEACGGELPISTFTYLEPLHSHPDSCLPVLHTILKQLWITTDPPCPHSLVRETQAYWKSSVCGSHSF